MNLDVADEALQPFETREVYNMLEEYSSGKIVNMKGFTSILDMAINADFALPSGTFKCVGTVYDIEEDKIIYFLCDTTGTNHSIMQMDTNTKALEWVLKSEEYLGLRSDYRVKADVIEGLLYWNFGYFNSFLNNDFNPPRKINTAKAVKFTDRYDSLPRGTVTAVGKADSWPTPAVLYRNAEGQSYIVYRLSSKSVFADGTEVVAWINEGDAYGYRYKPATGYGAVINSFLYSGVNYIVIDRIWMETNNGFTATGHIMLYDPDMYFGIDWQVLDRIVWPSSNEPSASYNNDTSVKSNNLRNDLFQFSFRYIKDDNEKSVFSPLSDVPRPTSLETLNGSTNIDPTYDNVIYVWYETGSIEVKFIEIAVRKGNTGLWSIVERISKYDEDDNVLITNDISALYKFYNAKLGTPVSQNEVARNADAVPLISTHQTIIEKNRLIDANYWEGFDNIDIDVALTSTQTEVEVGRIGGSIGDPPLPGEPAIHSIRHFLAKLRVFGNFITIQYFGAKFNIIHPPPATRGTRFWEPGFTYIININALPGRYDNPEGVATAGRFLELTYGEYFGMPISSSAIVDAPAGMSFENFINAVAAQLRVGSSFGKVIAINNYAYQTWGIYFDLYDEEYGDGVGPVGNEELGFIIEFVGGSPNEFGDCVNCAYVEIDILKVSETTVVDSFKSAAVHEFGLVYKDRAGRRTMVNRSDDSNIFIPAQTGDGTEHEIWQNKIGWTINHIPPLEAVSTQWVYAKNTSIGYFLHASIQGITNAPKSANIAASNATSISVNEYIVETHDGLRKFNVSPYTWESGDRLRFLFKKSDNNHYLTFPENLDFEILGVYYASGDTGYEFDDASTPVPIIDENGNKVRTVRGSTILINKIDYQSFGITADDTIVEIYRPKGVVGLTDASDSDEFQVYYDIGPSIPVLNPHTANRTHGGDLQNQSSNVAARGEFSAGNIYIAFRIMHNSFPCERYSFSDFFDSDSYWVGKQNAEDVNALFARYISKMLYSGKLIQDTRINDMSRVDSSDSITLADKYGSIIYIEEVGDTLKILQKAKNTSLRIGRAGVTMPTEEGREIISSTKDVLGTLIVHESDYGTVHPFSAVKKERRYFFFDFYSYAICRDANNGIQNISEAYGINAFMKAKCEAFGTADNVDVVGAWDQENDLIWFSFRDKTTSANSFTIAFREKLGTKEDGFIMFSHFIADIYGTAKRALTSFKDEGLWQHNSETALRANFYGIQYKYWFTVVFNKLPLTIKRWLTIFVGSPKVMSAPDAGDVNVPATGNNPDGMTSLIKAAAFDSVEGKWVAEFGRNMRTNQAESEVADLVNGDDMEGQTIEVRLGGDETDEHKTLSVEVEGVTSKI